MALVVFLLATFLSMIIFLIVKEIRDRNSVAFQATKVYPGPKIYPIIGTILEIASIDQGELEVV
jgi:hypothetical protein